MRRFWENDPNALLWHYGNELKKAGPERAMELYKEMMDKNIPFDQYAKNLYITALRKGNDRKYQEEIAKIERLYKFN